MSDPLGEVRAKFARAKEHSDTWTAAYTAWLDSQPHSVEPYRQPDGWFVVILRQREPPPLRLALIYADYMHNLRATLDHIVWHLVPDADRHNNTAFPVVEQSENWPSAKGNQLRGFPPKWRHIIKDAQPFQMGNRAKEHPLYLLHHLDIASKHHAVVGTRIVGVGWGGEFRFNRPTRDDTEAYVEQIPGEPTGEYVDGTELLRLRAVSKDGDLRIEELIGLEDSDVYAGPIHTLAGGEGPLPNFLVFAGTIIEAIAPAF